LNGIQEVRGSIPLSSTITTEFLNDLQPTLPVVFFFGRRPVSKNEINDLVSVGHRTLRSFPDSLAEQRAC